MPYTIHFFGMSLMGLSAYHFYKSDSFYNMLTIPVLHRLDPELSHQLTIWALKRGLVPKRVPVNRSTLNAKFCHLKLKTPIGIAAGFDKNGEAIYPLKNLGFGFIEVGSVTPVPQLGNEKPRVFRLSENNAIINRYGFNNDGHSVVYDRIQTAQSEHEERCIIGINLGKNKDSTDAVSDYVKGIEKFGDVVDYFVINISSPNTPGLRDLQKKEHLEKLLSSVLKARNKLENKPLPLVLLKLSPDLTSEEKIDIAKIINYDHCRIDGLIISNTTVQRSRTLKGEHVNEDGGLSGEPLADISTKMISEMYILTKGTVPIIGVGGIFSGEDAYEKIKAGASLIQLYTSFVYQGPPIIDAINKDLHVRLRRDGYTSISEAVGTGLK